MLNKKGITLFFVISLCAGGWWKSQTAPLSSSAVVLLRDRQKLEKNLKPEILNHKKWSQVNNYRIRPREIVNQQNARELFILNFSSAKELVSCLKKNFCGMERRNEDDAYFDESKTPGHILLGRNLDIILESLRINPALKDELDWDLIRELTDSENEKIQLLALEIIKEYDASSKDIAKLLDIANHFKGEAKARALEQIASKNSINDRIQLMNTLEESFSLDDPNTVISIVERIKQLRLSKEEVAKVSRNLCRFKENGIDDPNWKMIKYDMSKIVDLDKICN